MGIMDAPHIADRTFGVKQQERLVLEYLASESATFVEEDKPYSAYFQTRPWYNGRESGIVISMSVQDKETLHIAVFEHRNSDELCCLKWSTKHAYWNHPLEDPKIFEVAYGGGSKWDLSATFKYMQILECCQWVEQTFEDFYIAEMARPVETAKTGGKK